MTPIPTLAHLRKDSEFAAIFPDGAPVQGPLEQMGRFAGAGEQGFYRCDFVRCTEEQRAAVAKLVARACGGTADEVLAHWRAEGFLPLRVRHVESVSFDGRLML
jgi:hypothetical protein